MQHRVGGYNTPGLALGLGGLLGQLHQVGAALENAPSCNGWTYWCFRRDGKTVPIDVLRQQIRSEMS